MSRPWMPLYIADYLKDTTHLGALESGAYLHLIMDYWQNGKLPADDRQLARIAKMTDREWKVAKATLQSFFQDGWKHKRIDAEIAHSIEVSGKRKAAAAARYAAKDQQAGSTTDANADANADTLHTSQSTEERKLGAAPPETVVPIRREWFFEGQTTRWDQKTTDKWRKTFPAITDWPALFRTMDAYYTENPRQDGKYFFPAQKWIERESVEAPERERKAQRARGEAW